jgi:hypothetical protein
MAISSEGSYTATQDLGLYGFIRKTDIFAVGFEPTTQRSILGTVKADKT